MRTQKLIFGTNSRRALPFDIAGITFFAHPLTADDELQLADIGDRYDLDALEGADLLPFTEDMADALASTLRARAQGDAAQHVTRDWVLTHSGQHTQTNILNLLRTGKRDGPVELTPWLDEPFYVQDRPFTALPLNFRETGLMATIAAGDNVSSRQTLESTSGVLAQILTARALDDTTPVEPAWLTANLTAGDLTKIMVFLQQGEEGLDPNADADAETPGSPPSAADASSTS